VAVFDNLHHVSEVIAQVIGDHVGATPTGGIRSGAPLEDPDSAVEQVRITLLWVTPQPTHRNDPWERNASGGHGPPPLTVSGFYMISTYGLDANEEPVRAHELLGNVMQAFHTAPELSLPLASLPDRGEGRLTLVQVPTAADLMEKVYSPLQRRHRSWVLYEVGPIQVVMRADATEPSPVVRPGGLRLADIAVARPPVVTRVTPERQAEGGRIRVDVGLHGEALTGLRIGRVAVPPGLATFLDEGAFTVDLPDVPPQDIGPGASDVRVQTGDGTTTPVLLSEPGRFAVLPAATSTLDAPTAAVHDVSSALDLTGRGLDGATEVVLWPDGGVASPAAIRSLPPSSVTATSLSVTAAALQGALLGDFGYRLAVRVGDVFTPYVIVRFAP